MTKKEFEQKKALCEAIIKVMHKAYDAHVGADYEEFYYSYINLNALYIRIHKELREYKGKR